VTLPEQIVDISIIVPFHNRSQDLKKCVECLLAQDCPVPYEIILCDDGSTEDIESMVKETWQDEPRIRYHRQRQKGPAAARNLGIRHAHGEIVAMTDSDTLPQPGWLGKLREALGQHPEAVGVEGKVIADGEPFGILGVGPTNFSGGVYLTCNIACRRDALFKAGGLDESFPYPAYEDVELAAVMLELGPIVWEPDAVVIHPQRRETTRGTLKRLRHWKYLLIMGYRYGYFAWKQYPVKRYPRLHLAYLATVALPASKLLKATQQFIKVPKQAIELAWLGVVESVGALFWVLPQVLFARLDSQVERKNYLASVD
jgi:glycosyltransferase involved in cell wall biosynthesis